MTNWETLENRLLLTGTYTTYDAGLKKLTVTTAGLGISNDTIVISLSAGNTLSVSVGGVNDYNLASANSAAVLTLISVDAGSGNDSINLGATTKVILTQTLLNGGNGADTITGGGGPDEIYGGSGNDSIDGGLGSDSISGGADNDTVSYAIRATGVNVTLDAVVVGNDGAPGEGDNVGFNTTDVESIMGGAGNDTLTGSAAGNYISGGAGADLIHGMDGSDTLVGGAGGDSIYGDNDADFIFAKDGEFDLIDGGPGIDSADVDTSPAEAPPLPEAPVPSGAVSAPAESAAVSSSTASPAAVVSGSKKSAPAPAGTFSTRRIRRRNAALALAASRGTISAPSAVAAPLPSSGIEGPISQAMLPSVLQPLDPYTKGQALITRDDQGVVRIGGTNLDDSFIIRTSPNAGSPIDIYNNGGLTQFFLPTPSLLLSGIAGSDSIDVGGAQPGVVDASFKPDTQQPGAGIILVNSHAISLSTPGSPPVANVSFTDLNSLSYITPGTHDTLTLTATPGKNAPSQLSGQSGNLLLSTVTLNNVNGLTLDTGSGDSAADADDTITINVPSGGQLPQLSLLPGSTGKDMLQVNGPLVLANNPFKTGVPTLDVVTANPTASVTFLAPRVDLAALTLQEGSATIADAGDKVLVTKSLTIGAQAKLDITNNSLIVDFDGPPNPTAVIAAQIQSAYQFGAPTHWNGPGITSSTAAADPSKGIGYANSSVLFGPGGGNFMGVQVDDTATLVTFTLLGDANLNRQVGFADLVAVAQNYGQAGVHWITGDFNYDGTSDFSDLVSVAQNYGLSVS